MILGEMTDADKRVHPQHFWSDPVDIWIPKSGFESRITFWAWQSLRSPCALVSICNCSYIFVCITSHYKPTSSCPRRSHLRSTTSGQLNFPRMKTDYEKRSFAVNGPVVWNSLPTELRSPDISLDVFKAKLKTFLFNC